MTREQLKKVNTLVEELDRAMRTLDHLSEGSSGAHFQEAFLDLRTGLGTKQPPIQLLPEELEFVRVTRRNEVRRLTAELEALGVEPDYRIETF